MGPWLFLSKNGADEYINMFAKGCGGEITNTDDFDYHYDVIVDDRPVVLRGILKHKIMRSCWNDNKTFYYMDSGYFGNQPNRLNPQGWKLWHRIVKNDLQHNEIIPRPSDRWQQLQIALHPRRYGKTIIVAAPDDKPCKFYNIDKDTWVNETVATLKKHTDRPIIVRQRAPKRIDRVQSDPLSVLLARDVHALVTFNSVAATEAVMQGVPAFTMAPANAARPVGNIDLSKIETPYYPDLDTLHAWVHHLAYGQFHVDELRNGTAFRILTK